MYLIVFALMAVMRSSSRHCDVVLCWCMDECCDARKNGLEWVWNQRTRIFDCVVLEVVLGSDADMVLQCAEQALLGLHLRSCSKCG